MGVFSAKSEKSGLRNWTTRDLLVVAMIGIVAAILLMGVNYFSSALVAINPTFVSVLSGIYFINIIMAMYILRKPLACILVTVIYGLVSAPFHPFGWAVSLLAVIFAIPAELPFLVTHYRDYRLRILMLSGMAGCFVSFVITGLYGGYISLTLPVQVITLVLYLLSGAVIGGWGAKLLSDSLVKTGVLNNYAIAQSGQEEI